MVVNENIKRLKEETKRISLIEIFFITGKY